LNRIRTTIFFLIILIIAFSALLGRCYYLQKYRYSHYSEISQRQQQGKIPLQPQRGTVVDSRGRVLAASNKLQTIFAEPRIIKDPKEVSYELAEILNRDVPEPNRVGAHEICKIITESKNPGFVKLQNGVESDKISDIRKIYGLGVQSNWKRHYPMGKLLSHVVGFTSVDGRGIAGLELEYDEKLIGEHGQNIFLADAFRRPIKFHQDKNLSDGVGVVLTIDSTIQQFAREELLERFKMFEAEAGTAIVADPKTGAILAMVSLPDFDPEEPGLSDIANQRNRAITDQFEPGSIIKPIVSAIALDAGVVDQKTVIFCEDGNYHGKGFGQIREYRYHRYGNMTVKEILINSSNIGMAKIGQKLGKKRLYEGLSLFGFGSKTGIELPGEITGVLRPLDDWDGYSLTRVPFGQEITATALQMVRAFCILANGGRNIRPYIVKATVDNEGNVIKLKNSAPGVGYVIKPEIAKWVVQDALTAVVNEGTGTRAQLEKWQVFGKTGTANIALVGQRGFSKDNYVASFIAGAPAEDPRVIVLVSIRKPNKSLGKGYTGGVVASPAVRNIIEKTLNYLENFDSRNSDQPE